MRFICATFVLLLVMMTSAQCQQTAEDWYNKGIALNSQGQYDEAIQAFDEAIKLMIQVQNMPVSTAITGLNNAASENNEFRIIGIDSTAYPKVKASVFVDKFCAMAGNLKKKDFKVKEDDNDAAIDNVYFTGNASGQKLDLAIVFDETTSMDEEIDALKSKVKDLTQKINSSKLDARYSLVTFNGADVKTKINWTNDADSFRNVIGKLTTSGGNTELPENSLDGIEQVLSFGFRPDAQKVIIVVTDEPSQQKGDGKSNSAYTMEDVKSDLLNSGATLIAVSPDFRNRNDDPGFQLSNLPKYADMRELRNEASGLWIDIDSADFSTILKKIQGILTGIYTIEYTSLDLAPSDNKNILVSVNNPECMMGSDSSFYKKPENVATFTDSDLAMVWYNKGIALNSQGQYDEAITAYDEAIRLGLDPNYAEARNNKGEILKVIGDPNLALDWYNKGIALNSQGQYDEAITAYDEAIRLDPNYAVAWNNKGTALSNQGNYDEAIQAFDEAIMLDLNYAVAWNNKGTVLCKQVKCDEAIPYLEEAIRLDPNLADAYFWSLKAGALYKQGKYNEAITAYDEAIRLDPNRALVWNNKGTALSELGKYDEAIEAYDEAIRLDPNLAIARNSRGNILNAQANKGSGGIGRPPFKPNQEPDNWLLP
jgi:tetratricopeptide (TPR) repeat protein